MSSIWQWRLTIHRKQLQARETQCCLQQHIFTIWSFTTLVGWFGYNSGLYKGRLCIEHAMVSFPVRLLLHQVHSQQTDRSTCLHGVHKPNFNYFSTINSWISIPVCRAWACRLTRTVLPGFKLVTDIVLPVSWFVSAGKLFYQLCEKCQITTNLGMIETKSTNLLGKKFCKSLFWNVTLLQAASTCWSD